MKTTWCWHILGFQDHCTKWLEIMRICKAPEIMGWDLPAGKERQTHVWLPGRGCVMNATCTAVLNISGSWHCGTAFFQVWLLHLSTIPIHKGWHRHFIGIVLVFCMMTITLNLIWTDTWMCLKLIPSAAVDMLLPLQRLKSRGRGHDNPPWWRERDTADTPVSCGLESPYQTDKRRAPGEFSPCQELLAKVPGGYPASRWSVGGLPDRQGQLRLQIERPEDSCLGCSIGHGSSPVPHTPSQDNRWPYGYATLSPGEKGEPTDCAHP